MDETVSVDRDDSHLNSAETPSVNSFSQGDEESYDGSPKSITDEISADFSEKSTSIQKYEEEWAALYYRQDPEMKELCNRAVSGNLRASRFRSVCWRVLLGVFPHAKDGEPAGKGWLPELQQCRKHYALLYQKLLADPWHGSLISGDDPLSQNSESTWHQYFCDKELKALIRQDVVRTFPGIDFFRDQMIQDAMVNILFCYAREHPTMCYRQGMHEILAPLLFVLHCDHQALLHTKEQVQVREEIAEILDPKFLEEDAYAIFSKIIHGIASCYRIKDLTPTATGYFPANVQTPSPNGDNSRSENEIVTQLNRIRDELLAHRDVELHQHLQQLDIPFPLFGIRWLRLLFGREFPLQDLLVLWDAIFAEGQNFELVNYVVVAMLIAIRHQLLDSDYTGCLTYLMRYPGAVDISHIIDHALYLKDPQKYHQPETTSFPNLPVVTVGGRPDLNRAKQQVVVATSEKVQNLIHRKGSGRNNGSISDRFKKLSTKSGRWVSQKAPPGPRADSDSTIVDGYTLDDPALLQAELEHAHAVMALCRLKLQQYQITIRKALLSTEINEALQALDGINELCSLLNSRHRTPPPAEVEPALEAGELQQHPPHQRIVMPPDHLVTKVETLSRLRMPSRGEVEMKVMSTKLKDTTISIKGMPMENPLLAE